MVDSTDELDQTSAVASCTRSEHRKWRRFVDSAFSSFGDRDIPSHRSCFFADEKWCGLGRGDEIDGTSRSTGDNGGDWSPPSHEMTDGGSPVIEVPVSDINPCMDGVLCESVRSRD